MKTITQIPALATYPVRHPVLRPGKPLESCHFDGDDLRSTVHFGIFVDAHLAGVTSLFDCSNPLFNARQQNQLRGMAILPDFQKKGLGEDLLKHVEDFAAKKNAALIWFNARITAVPFYEKWGYQVSGEAFTIGDIGAHFVMFKTLNR